MDTTTLLAGATPVGDEAVRLILPVVAALALISWIALVFRGFMATRHTVGRRPDQSPHRGPIEGGLYRYSPGMYSHSYPPGAVPEMRENPETAAETPARKAPPDYVPVLERPAKRERHVRA
ncbi:hypothetical protein [Actinomadura macrotermitis]|uniref:Uncharacterized protein n=1 Tax=Actinomadura macrotermitis TaxID=2585200 RepID=A0A7K0BU41_9ACTN|nr:hypothetical protein [Actinomadura macrotermitis]MQY04412.1 hypothetical protein [Actinomadura macrotermitis]